MADQLGLIDGNTVEQLDGFGYSMGGNMDWFDYSMVELVDLIGYNKTE